VIKTNKPVLLQRTHTTHPPPCRTNSRHYSHIHPRARTATSVRSPRANHPFTRRSMATSISSLRTFCTVYQYAPAQNVNNAPAIATFPPLRDWCRALNDIAPRRTVTTCVLCSTAVSDAWAHARGITRRRRAPSSTSHARRDAHKQMNA